MEKSMGNNLSNAFIFFDLDYNYTLDDLERKKYEYLLINKDIDKVNEYYNLLLSFKLNNNAHNQEEFLQFDFAKYKDMYIKNIKNKYTKYPSYFIGKDNLNKYLDNIKLLINDTINDLTSIETLKEFKEAINYFYGNYIQEVSVFINEYFYELIKKNKNKAAIDINYAKEDTLKDILNYNLSDLISVANDNIKKAVDNYKIKIKMIDSFNEPIKYVEDALKNSQIFDNYIVDIDKFINQCYKKYENLILYKKINNDDDLDDYLMQCYDEFNNESKRYGAGLYIRLKGELLEKNQELYDLKQIDASTYLFNKNVLEKTNNPNEITKFYYLLNEPKKSR